MAFPPLRRYFRQPLLLLVAIRTVQILAAGHLFITTIAESRKCTGFSMLPTLSHEGDVVLISPISYWGWKRRRGPKRGDLVFASSPRDPQDTVCKRVIGIEGDVLEVEPRIGGARKWMIEGSEGEVGGRELDTTAEHHRGEGEWVRVPKGHIWLAGDNLSNSTDSRTYGPMPLAMVKGKVLARVGSSGFIVSSRLMACSSGPASSGSLIPYGPLVPTSPLEIAGTRCTSLVTPHSTRSSSPSSMAATA
jgi:inner membrane protease subunit 1